MGMFGSDGWFSPVTSALTGGLQTGWNIGAQLWNWHRQDQLNDRMFARDDNAVQRRVADLKAAGLSPILAAGSAAGNSSPMNSAPQQIEFTPVERYLGAIKSKADIASTNAGTALTTQQAENEKLRHSLISGEINYNDVRTRNMELQNQWFTANQMAKIALINAQTDNQRKQIEKMNGEIAFNTAKTALTLSDTAYRNTELDLLKTNIDNAKIMRELNLQNMFLNPFDKASSIFSRGGVFGKIANNVLGFGSMATSLGNMIDATIKSRGFDRTDFWDYN